MNLYGRDFLKLLDFTTEEIEYLIDLAAELKDKKKRGVPHDICRGKNVALIFEKTSTHVAAAPIPRALITLVDVASVGHVPRTSTSTGFSFIIPFEKLFSVFISLPP